MWLRVLFSQCSIVSSAAGIVEVRGAGRGVCASDSARFLFNVEVEVEAGILTGEGLEGRAAARA